MAALLVIEVFAAVTVEAAAARLSVGMLLYTVAVVDCVLVVVLVVSQITV